MVLPSSVFASSRLRGTGGASGAALTNPIGCGGGNAVLLDTFCSFLVRRGVLKRGPAVVLPARVGSAGRLGYRSDLNAARTSALKRSGSSQAAKCPPRSTWL